MARPDSRHLLLEVRNLSVEYAASNGTVHAVRNVSFSLRRGTILGLAGESGSGKSTLAYAIARLLRSPAVVTGGEAFYYPNPELTTPLPGRRTDHPLELARHDPLGRINILQLSSQQLRLFRWNEMSIVFQSAMNALNPVMDIGSQIIDVLETHQPERGRDACQRRARELLEMVGIAAERLKSYPHELSGGMRQRAAIAIALALQPELIIMDEPTTALDVVVQREILELISALCKELGTSLIFITHDLSLLLELADEIAVMYAGRLIEQAPQRELHQHPRHPYTFGLVHSFPSMYGPRRWMTGIPGSPPDLREIPPGCAFHVRCPFSFTPCQMLTPELRPATAASPRQLVACHLYDSNLTLTTAIPDASTLAGGYKAQGEWNRR